MINTKFISSFVCNASLFGFKNQNDEGNQSVEKAKDVRYYYSIHSVI